MSTDVFLDVDGVINAVTWKREKEVPAGWPEHKQVKVNGFTITYAPELINRLNALAARDDVTFHWLTTWEHDAPNILSEQIGLNGKDWPVLVDPRPSVKFSDYSWWKLYAAKKHALDSENRIVWIDDDLYDTTAREWLATQGARILAVQPSSHIGVTRDLMDNIEHWIDHGTLKEASA